MSRFAEVLEQLREKKQIRKKDLTQRSGLSSGYISLLTRGNRSAPSEEVVAALADAMELDAMSRVRLFEAAGYSAETALAAISSASSSLASATQPSSPHITGPLIAASQDWGDVPNVQMFCGRTQELETLGQWIIEDRTKMVAVLGMGGVGKTMLCARLAEQLQGSFDYIFWRSLLSAPPLEQIIRDCIQLFSGQRFANLPEESDQQLLLLIEYLRDHRCLLILDNFETVLQPGSPVGRYQEGYDGYGKLLQQIGGGKHQSTLVLTSREKPGEVAMLEGRMAPVRSRVLEGLTAVDGRAVLGDKELQGDERSWDALIGCYAGNPLALKLVAQVIQDIFNGDIVAFLKDGPVIFSDIRDVLDQQWQRLSFLEQQVMYWLAIEREPASLTALQEELISQPARRELIETFNSLKRRSLIETRGAGQFGLQAVIMEYITDRFVEHAYQDIMQEEYELLTRHALMQADAREYVQAIQRQFLLAPLAHRLVAALRLDGCIKKLREMVEQLRHRHLADPFSGSYAAGNILNLLVHLNVDLKNYDFSHLAVRQAYLQHAPLHSVNFMGSNLSESVFTDTFGSIFSVALNTSGELLAAGTANGEIRVWSVASGAPVQILRGHTEWVRAVAFSADGALLASGSEDQTVRLWDVRAERCLAVFQGHRSTVYSVAFSSDGSWLASGSGDRTVRLWDVRSRERGKPGRVLGGHGDRIFSVAWSPDGSWLASGSGDRTVKLWNMRSGQCEQTLHGHTQRIRAVAFSPDGELLASGGGDQTIRLWDMRSRQRGRVLKVLTGHEDWIWSVAFDKTGRMLASGSDDRTIRLWDVHSGVCLKVLQAGRVYGVAFSPGGNTIAGGSDGQMVRLWDAHTGESLKTLQGHGDRIYTLAFHPGGELLASGSEDGIVSLWDTHQQEPREFSGHTHWILSVTFSASGAQLASSSEDRTIRIWNPFTGEQINELHGHDSRIYSIAFGPQEHILASGSGDQTVRLWDTQRGECLRIFTGHESRVYSVAWNPQGSLLASGSADQMVRLWDVQSGKCISILVGHEKRVRSVRFSPDGKLLASCGDDQTIRLWDVQSGECRRVLRGHPSWVWSVAFHPDGKMLVSCGEDGSLRLWDVETSTSLAVLQGQGSTLYAVALSPGGSLIASGNHEGMIEIWDLLSQHSTRTLRKPRPYERMNIRGVTGLTQSQKAVLRELGAVEL